MVSEDGVRLLGEKLKGQRGPRGIRETAAEIGISAATLSRVERGNVPDLETFSRICSWLKLDPADVLGLDIPTRPTAAGPPRIMASVHFKADQTPSPELSSALAEMILAAQQLLAEQSS